MPMQIKRRLGAAGAPIVTSLVEGQLAYNDPGTTTYDGLPIAHDDALYIRSEDSVPDPIVRTLVSATRQVELAGSQTITGTKTIATSALKLTGATATNQILTVSNITNGDLAWTTAPSGGLMSVATDGVTIGGDGVAAATQLEVLSVPEHDITIQTRAAQPDGSITNINITAAAYDATGDAIMTNFAITRLDDGTY